ncbi:MAG TPA: fatty acid desaturase, partial [Sunxiuqinia sp.]|nr:fatty acid desaturase [Sunxiuqinia sp.]
MGVLIAIVVILCWLLHLLYSLFVLQVEVGSVGLYFHVLVQAYLYTGLFITGHDAMHGLISNSRKVNTVFGWISSLLFAGLSYKKLRTNHYNHHQFPATENDPDYYIKSQNFFVWWAVFL